MKAKVQSIQERENLSKAEKREALEKDMLKENSNCMIRSIVEIRSAKLNIHGKIFNVCCLNTQLTVPKALASNSFYRFNCNESVCDPERSSGGNASLWATRAGNGRGLHSIVIVS